MLCERCGQRPATVHITEITNGSKKETHICQACAGEIQPQGFGFVPQLNLNNFLAGFLHELGGAGSSQAVDTGEKCEQCGMAEGQFVKLGLMGCDSCYSHFEERLLPLLRRIHGNIRHTGKVPERTGGRAKVLKAIESLKGQLQEVISREEFEQAADLRDTIRQLEKNLDEGSEG
ncbi:MAG: UvrB/UvrC motif-containing protein [Desulfotomaculaceae bacterium]|nr:UvrB/UvrC motif-containing protein [Desulfotomaculaceae bacterium]